MGSKEEINDISKQLDSLSLRMLQLMKDYIDTKLTLEELIKSGSLHLAKSRYIMGNRSVSVLQLPTEDSQLNASVKVVGSEDVEGLSLSLSRVCLKDSQDNEIKQRKQQTIEDDEEKEEKTSDDPKESSGKTIMQDPIKWFGVLIPQNLRQAQTTFSKALDYSVQCVNLQLEMTRIEERHKELIAKKKTFLESRPKSQSN